VESFSIPVSFLIPFRPVNLEVKLKSQAKIYLTITHLLKAGLPSDSLDELAFLQLKWLDINPLPNTTSQMYSFLVAPNGLKNGSIIPCVKCNASDEQSFS
jgi:hypothetical protein